MTTAHRHLIAMAILLLTAASASAQQKPQPQLRGFGVVLLEGSQQPGGSSELSQSASAAIADIRDFLPFKSYRLLDSSWTLGSNIAQEYVSRLRGGTQEFQVRIGSKVDAASAGIDVKFTLAEAGYRDSWYTGAIADMSGKQHTLSRAALIDTSFTMRIGETVVVGTSRVGGDKALIVLLTAVPLPAKP